MEKEKINKDTTVEAISSNTIITSSNKDYICESNQNVKDELKQLTEDK